MKKIIWIGILIAVGIFGVYTTSIGIINLQQTNKEIDEARPYFEDTFSTIFEMCKDSLILDDYDLIKICHEQLKQQLEFCSFYGNPPVCNDPIIREVELKIQSPKPDVPEQVIDFSTIELATYTNNEFGFSIDYPSNWVIDEEMPFSKFGNYIVAFKDRPEYPKVFFSVKEEHSKDSSFDKSFEKYKEGLGREYTVSISSEKKIQLGNLEAYEIEYSTFIGSTECFEKEFVIDMKSSFIPIVSWSTCAGEEYEKYLPLFERIAYTLRPNA